MNESMEENQNKQTQSKETPKPKTQEKKSSQSETDNHHAYRYKEPHSLSLSRSLRVFLNSCCSNTAPEFTLVAAASPSSIMAQQHHPKTKIAPKTKKKVETDFNSHL
jgi:hypothetical protein